MKLELLLATNLLVSPLFPCSAYAYRTTLPLEQRINEVEKIALKKKGLKITEYHHPVQLGEMKTNLNLRFEYECGPRGGSGALRALFYLDSGSWPSTCGIKEIRFFLLSPEATNMSVKEYEVNLNLHTNHITYEPVEQRALISNYFFDTTKEIFYKIVKKDKQMQELEKNIEKAKLAGNIVKEVIDDELRQAVVEAGNLIIKEHVWIKEFNYKGHGFLDIVGKPRAPKVYELEIKTGECSVKGIFVKATICGFSEAYVGEGHVGTKKYEEMIEFAAPLDVEMAAKAAGANPENEQDKEGE